jgi:hypothetical protein
MGRTCKLRSILLFFFGVLLWLVGSIIGLDSSVGLKKVLYNV